MKDPFDFYMQELSKHERELSPKTSAKDSKIVSLEEEEPFHDFFPSLEELEGIAADFHPLFAECMLALMLVMPVSYMALDMPQFKKHRRLVEKAESKFRPDDPLSPILESYFNMWTLFDAEVGKTGKVLADLLPLINDRFEIEEEQMRLVERMKMTYTGVYVCEEKSEGFFKLREIPSGKSIEAILEAGYEDKIEKEDLVFVRLIENPEDGNYVELSCPYIIRATEDDWIDFFAEHGIGQGESFDFQKYRTLMKRGVSHYFWLNYIDHACRSIDDMTVVLEGTPLALAARSKGLKRF